MIDPETGWSEIVQYKHKQAYTLSNLVEQTWLYIYLKPTIFTYDPGNEFLVHAVQNDLSEMNTG